MKLQLKSTAELSDGVRAEIADLIVDPTTRRVTHLVVHLHGHSPGAHLVPVEALIWRADHPTLSWSGAEVSAAPRIEGLDTLDLEAWPHLDGAWDVGVIRMQAGPAGPSIWADATLVDAGYGLMSGPVFAGRPASVTLFDRIPRDSAEIRHDSVVLTADRHLVGHVTALVLDERYQVTAVVVDRGHLWTRREIEIPLRDVASVATDRVALRVLDSAVAQYDTSRHGHPEAVDRDVPPVTQLHGPFAEYAEPDPWHHARATTPTDPRLKRTWSW